MASSVPGGTLRWQFVSVAIQHPMCNADWRQEVILIERLARFGEINLEFRIFIAILPDNLVSKLGIYPEYPMPLLDHENRMGRTMIVLLVISNDSTSDFGG